MPDTRTPPDKRAPDPVAPANGPGQPGSATQGQPSGIDLENESAAGEEDPGAALDAPPGKD